jgi:predicted nucleic acid-binding protein
MTKLALDSNILVYAELEPESDKGVRAQKLIEEYAQRGVLAVQCLLEFIAVIKRKRIASLPSALQKIDAWTIVFETAPTTDAVMRDALMLVRDHQIQVWDAVICAAVSNAGAGVLLSEDLQDGASLSGMRVVNPFTRSDEELKQLLG